MMAWKPIWRFVWALKIKYRRLMSTQYKDLPSLICFVTISRHTSYLDHLSLSESLQHSYHEHDLNQRGWLPESIKAFLEKMLNIEPRYEYSSELVSVPVSCGMHSAAYMQALTFTNTLTFWNITHTLTHTHKPFSQIRTGDCLSPFQWASEWSLSLYVLLSRLPF